MENGKITNLMQFKIQPIAGDASFRKFYRVRLNKSSKIIALAEKEKYKNIIVYCRSGNRSKTATKILIENDFKAVNLIGGIKEWNGPIASEK